MNNIEVKEANIEEVLKVHKYVPEFSGTYETKEEFEHRYKDHDNVIIIAYSDNNPIGYMIGYDRYKDNKNSFYCWLAGVNIDYRRHGALTEMMNYLFSWAKEKGYEKIKIRTRNSRREMLTYLMKNEWLITSAEGRENILDNRINLEKEII